MAKYETKLSSDDEKDFKKWFKKAKNDGVILEQDDGRDYDFRGYWKDFVKENGSDEFSAETHFPDTYKKPNHETFSTESKYAKGKMKKYAGSWDGDTYLPPKEKYNERENAADVLYD